MLYLCGNLQFVDAAHHTQHVHYALCHVHYALCHVHHALCHVHYALCHVHYALCHVHHTQHVHYALCHVHHALCHLHCTVQLVDTLIVLVVGRAEYQRFRSAEKVCIGLWNWEFRVF